MMIMACWGRELCFDTIFSTLWAQHVSTDNIRLDYAKAASGIDTNHDSA